MKRKGPAIAIIAEAAATWPVTFPAWLEEEGEREEGYAASLREGHTKAAFSARAAACYRAVAAVEGGTPDRLADDMGAGIVALNVACRMLNLDRAERTAAAVAQWRDK